MKRLLLAPALLAAALTLPLSGADTEINLVPQGAFKPVMMHGKPSAAFGWYLRDQPRSRFAGKTRRYLSGEGLFELKFENGAVTFVYPDPIHPAYVKSPVAVDFCPRLASPQPPAEEYVISARVKFCICS